MTTYITFVLDETSSMDYRKEETIAGFNEYVKTLSKELAGEDVKFSMMKFNSTKKDWLCLDIGLRDVVLLSNDNFRPYMYTPLIDAFGMALKHMETKDLTDEDKVIITVMTDGEENASTEYTIDQIKSMIKENPDWQIVFLGAEIDAWDIGRDFGLQRRQTYSFTDSDALDTYGTVALASANYSKGSSVSINIAEEFEDAESN